MKNTGTEGAEGWLKGQRSYRSLPPPGHHPTAATYGCSLFAESRVDLTASRLLSRWRESTLESTSKSPGRESTPPVQASIREVPSVKELTAHHVDVHFLISRAMIGFFPTAIYLIHLKLFKTSPWVCVCVSECVSPFKSIDTNRKKKKKKFQIRGNLQHWIITLRVRVVWIYQFRCVSLSTRSSVYLFIYFTVRVLFQASDLITAIVWLLVLLIKAGDPLYYPTDYNGQSLVDLH